MWHVPPQIPPSHNKSGEDGASLSFPLLAAQKAAAEKLCSNYFPHLILSLLKRASKFDSFNFFCFSNRSGGCGLSRREELRGDPLLLLIIGAGSGWDSFWTPPPLTRNNRGKKKKTNEFHTNVIKAAEQTQSDSDGRGVGVAVATQISEPAVCVRNRVTVIAGLPAVTA